MADLTINFGFVSDAQSGKTHQREIEAATNGFARLIVDNIAFTTASSSRQEAHRVLAGSVRKAVDAEISHMAMTIGNSLAITERARGPQGVMSVHEGLSRTARDRGWAASSYNWNRNRTGIKWGERHPRYMKWKATNGYSRKWWSLSGDLKGYLSQPQTYTQSFGPVRVLFDRPKNQDRARMSVGNGPRLTASGMTGPITATYEVGKLRVIALGNITPDDLPSLRTEDPKDAKPRSEYGLAGYLRDRTQAAKLIRPAYGDGLQRHVLEPFVSFYLTRAIPNAVWRRIEQTPLKMDIGAGRTR